MVGWLDGWMVGLVGLVGSKQTNSALRLPWGDTNPLREPTNPLREHTNPLREPTNKPLRETNPPTHQHTNLPAH